MRGDARVIVAKVDIDRWEEQEQEMVKGSTIDTCRVCGDSVWLSPEGHRFAYETVPDDSEIVCVECHIRLEIERRKEGGKKRIKAGVVPGTSVGPASVATFEAITETVIQEGLREQATQEVARPLRVVRDVQGELDEEVDDREPQDDGDDPEGEPQDGDPQGGER